jgi:uncharacterized membrane protein YedE/YeeE
MEPAFLVPKAAAIDRKVLLGAGIFGVGWGLGGFCPGPALVGLAFGHWQVFALVAGMAAGVWLYDGVHAYLQRTGREPLEPVEPVHVDG